MKTEKDRKTRKETEREKERNIFDIYFKGLAYLKFLFIIM